MTADQYQNAHLAQIWIGSDGRVLESSATLHQLCGLPPEAVPITNWEQFLAAWQEHTGYAASQWEALCGAIDQIRAGRALYGRGELEDPGYPPRSIGWTVRPARNDGSRSGAVELRLHGITGNEYWARSQGLRTTINYEIRSPITSIKAVIELLMRGAAGTMSDQQRELLKIAASSTDSLLDALNTLLEFSRLERGYQRMELAACSVYSLVQPAVERLAQEIDPNKSTIDIAIPSDLAAVRADAHLIELVMRKLLGSTVRSDTSKMIVRAAHLPTEQPNEQETHAMLSRAPAREVMVAIDYHGGNGYVKYWQHVLTNLPHFDGLYNDISLFVCVLVIEAHGGRIWFESISASENTIYFTLPVAHDGI